MGKRRIQIIQQRRQAQKRKKALIYMAAGIGIIGLLAYGIWNTSRLAEPLASETLIAFGAQVYSNNCAVCHGENGEGHASTPLAPALNDREHAWHHADGQLQELILEGGIEMPAFEEILEDQEVVAVIRYFQTWWQASQLDTQQARSVSDPLR
ncbi:MAG: cytochrome c [Chloroflexi bacterium]|nr:cytochrome c [Chloroflexota bacterium]